MSKKSSARIAECYYHQKLIKKVPIVIGGLYEVVPINPSKKKLRGERVRLIEAEDMMSAKCLRIDSDWHVKRESYTEIDICDLKLISNGETS